MRYSIAPVHSGLRGPYVLHHEGRGPGAQVEVGAVAELELVAPPAARIPCVVACVVAEKMNMISV